MDNGKWGALILLVFVVATASAQYEEPRDFAPLEARYVAVGVLDRDWVPNTSNPLADSTGIRYRVWMPMISFHQGPVQIAFGYSRYTRGGESKEAVHFGTVLTNEVGIGGPRSRSFSIPLCLAADFTKAEAVGPKRDNFNIASLGVGAGLRYQYQSPAVDFGIHALGIIHFAFEGLGTGSGSSAALDCDARVMIKSVHIADGIVLGYRLRIQRWNMSDETFNYHATSHGPYLGVMF
jgi:hypothetical protein